MIVTPTQPPRAGRSVAQSDAHPSKAAAQRARLLEALKLGPVSTFDAREALDIASPAPRVLELRRAGHDITTRREARIGPAGEPHRVGVYSLHQ